MLKKDYILLFMCFCYVTPIILVYSYYNSNNNSVSSIICKDSCRNIIFFFMLFMGWGTLLYEMERDDTVSIVLILFLLIGIYGLICINENNIIHYFFAFSVFITILLFMIRHCYNTNCNLLLTSSFLLEVLALIFIIANIKKNIFFGEILYILNFAFFYLYLHFI